MTEVPLIRLAALVAVLWIVTPSPASAETTTFGFTGAEQTYTVPVGVNSIHVVAIGAKGGEGTSGAVTLGGRGGSGGRVEADLAVVPGQMLFVEVGGVGGDAALGTAGIGGFNGGGASAAAVPGGGGGGSTDLRACSRNVPGCPPFDETLESRLIVGGGGGGGGAVGIGAQSPGGAGGNAGQNGTAGQATSCFPGRTAGGGGTAGSESRSGAGGTGGNNGAAAGNPGGFGFGGAAAVGGSSANGGGGGGSGWFGGGAGGSANECAGGGGGGGSNFAASGASNVTFATASGDPAGVVITTPGPPEEPPDEEPPDEEPPDEEPPDDEPPAEGPPAEQPPKAAALPGLMAQSALLTKPSNAFRLGKLTRNTRNGTGLLVVDLPGTGTLSLTGRGLTKRQQSVGTAGSVELAIKTKGSFVVRLARAGQLKLTASITFTPTGGDPSTRTRLIKLIED